MSEKAKRIPDAVLRQIAKPAPGSDGPVWLKCAIGKGMGCVVLDVSTADLAAELLKERRKRSALQGKIDRHNDGARYSACGGVRR